MNVKRFISTLLGVPLTVAILLTKNAYIIDISITIIALICLYELYKAFETKYKPVKWIGYISVITILFIHFYAKTALFNVIIITLFILFILLFLQVFLKKIDIIDASITFMGVCYITIFILFIPLIVEIQNGSLLIWYIFGATWGTDGFAYLIGKNFGKHKFTEISPKKTIEGCIGGIFGAVIFMISITYVFNTWCGLNISYINISIIGIILSIFSQIGDLIASSIKRYFGIKDFGNLIPGHGGMLDRFDSVIIAAPLAYILFTII